MKNKFLVSTCCSILLVFLTGCVGNPSAGGMKGGYTDTSVKLSERNFKLIKGGAMGKSRGFWLLFIPIADPSYADAKASLYRSVESELKPGETLTGKAIALANQTEDRSSLMLILFSIPKVTITADVIEFTDSSSAK